MAVDHALASACLPGRGVLRLYSWTSPTVSFGRNEPAREAFDPAVAAREGLAFVRRPTGGRSVLHDAEMTYSVVAPIGALGGLKSAYRRINAGLVTALQALGVDAWVSEGTAVPRLDAGPCFQAPAPGEVVAEGRKIIGSAQARLKGAVLQHGSLILKGDQDRLVRMTGRGGDARPPAALEDLVGPVAWATLVDEVWQGLRLALGGCWTEAGHSLRERERATRFERRYASDRWTWRR